MNNEMTISLSQKEFEERVFVFMNEVYGSVSECKSVAEKDIWYARLGMMLDFVSGMFDNRM